MSLRTHSLNLTVSLLAGVLLAGVPQTVQARGGSNGADASGVNANLQVERRKLVGDLERANADIEQLKKKERGVRDDYRLRARMADAEAIARRLTEIDAQLNAGGPRGGNLAPRPVAPVAEPTVGDGPNEWEARADILTDQSRRLAAQAATLSQRVSGLRSRLELRRRAGQLESDPFAPMEGSKRRLIAGLPSALPSPNAGGSNGNGPTVAGPAGRGAGDTSSPTGGSTQGPGSNIATPPSAPVMAGAGTSGPPEALSAGNAGKTNIPAPTPVLGGASGGPTTGGGNTDSGNNSLSAQLRDFLDPAALAAIRKLELAGTPVANVEAMERAAAALAERAAKLQAQSKTLRERARSAR